MSDDLVKVTVEVERMKDKTMSEAPERIWVEPKMAGYLDKPDELYIVEYVRADRIKELESVVKEAVIQSLSDLGSDYEIDCATKEEWAQRAFNAEARIKELEAILAELKGKDDGSA